MTEKLWLTHVLAISSLKEKKLVLKFFSIKNVNETTGSRVPLEWQKKWSGKGLHPPSPLSLLNKETSSWWKHQLGTLGQHNQTQASLLCGWDTGFCTDHLPTSTNS